MVKKPKKDRIVEALKKGLKDDFRNPFSNKHYKTTKCPKTKKKFKLIPKMLAYNITPSTVCSECGEEIWQGVKKYTGR